MLLKFYGPGMYRNRPHVGNIFMRCWHQLRLPWRFLTQPELQQGSDRLNYNQKHFLMLHAIKINCIYINEQVASIFSCNLRSDSTLERHFGPAFSVTPAKRTLILAARNFEPAARNFVPAHHMYQLKILSCTSHPVTMSGMPPLDNYITICIFIEKPWQALDITMVGLYHVQMWKWIVMIFLCDISVARGMLKSLRNHRQLQRPNGKKWRIFRGRCWEKNSLSWSLNRLQLSLYQQAGGTRSKYNHWRRKGLTDQ